MKYLFRAALLSTLALLLVQLAPPLGPNVFAGATTTPSTIKNKKKKKHKKNKEVVLKGRHGKRSRKPA